MYQFRRNELSANESTYLSLTDREIECLLWCARGKTSFEISKIVGLSEHTINQYIVSACRSLETVNRTHAVVMALKLGIIDIDTV